jgi:hypothetical protein
MGIFAKFVMVRKAKQEEKAAAAWYAKASTEHNNAAAYVRYVKSVKGVCYELTQAEERANHCLVIARRANDAMQEAFRKLEATKQYVKEVK